MPARKIRPEVLRPFLLVVAMIVTLFVLQFLRPVPPDIRAQNLQKTYTADLQRLYAALQQYQGKFDALPADWADLVKIGFSLESLDLPDAEPKHPAVTRTGDTVQVQNMPFRLVQQGKVDWAGPRKALIEFPGAKEMPPATVYTDGTTVWGRAG